MIREERLLNEIRKSYLCPADGEWELWSRPLAAKAFMGAGFLACGIAIAATGAHAGDPEVSGVDYYSQLSCGQLWYERNAIFARHGYCFKNPRAIQTFGQGCQPPYGQLPSNLQGVVRNIQAWEQKRGCR